MKHTELPWTPNKFRELRDPSGKQISVWNLGISMPMSRTEESEANAAFIVKAVNNHDNLLASVKRLINCMAYNGFGETIDKAAYAHAKEAIKQAEAE